MAKQNITPINGNAEKEEKVSKETEVVNEGKVEKETKVKEKKRVTQQRKRVPLGTRNILTANKRPGYKRRFVNDIRDRVAMFQDAGWNIVSGDVKVGDDKAGRPSNMGNIVNPSVGVNQRAVLMEIPDELYEEDEKRKQAEITQVENEIKRNVNKDGLSGKISIS